MRSNTLGWRFDQHTILLNANTILIVKNFNIFEHQMEIMTSNQIQDKYADLKRVHWNLPFNKYQSDIYSQNGEDGVIYEILTRLELWDQDNWCVEFGAWDGKHLSNTFALVKNHSFNAIYIEGNKNRYQELVNTATENPSIIPICAYVSRFPCEPNSLDNLLALQNTPSDFTLLSIDIDSHDLDVWESLSDYQPKVVIIEINSSVLPGIVWRHSKKTPGNTFSATCNVAHHKGYTLVCHTGNLIFVRNDQVAKLNIEERYVNFPELLFLFDSIWIQT